MKTYDVHRGPQCPTGRHEIEDGATRPNPDCDCTWLVIGSSTPVPHTTGFKLRELERLVKEADEGYFDPAWYPQRKGSRFLSPFVQRLVELAETDPLGAAQNLLSTINFDQVAWDPATGCLSLRARRFGSSGVEHEWLQLWLSGSDDREQWAARAQSAGGDGETIEGIWSEPLAIEETPAAIELDEASRARVRAAIGASAGKDWREAALAHFDDVGDALARAAFDELVVKEMQIARGGIQPSLSTEPGWAAFDLDMEIPAEGIPMQIDKVIVEEQGVYVEGILPPFIADDLLRDGVSTVSVGFDTDGNPVVHPITPRPFEDADPGMPAGLVEQMERTVADPTTRVRRGRPARVPDPQAQEEQFETHTAEPKADQS